MFFFKPLQNIKHRCIKHKTSQLNKIMQAQRKKNIIKQENLTKLKKNQTVTYQ